MTKRSGDIRQRRFTRSADESLDFLYPLKRDDVVQHQSRVEKLLEHRNPEVRRAAAEALGIGGVGSESLRSRLQVERNELALVEILDSLAALQDVKSLPTIYRLASNHRSELIRSWAVRALQEIDSERDPVPFLKERLLLERSPRACATISYVLVYLGDEESLPRLIRGVRSRSATTRRGLANLIAEAPPIVGRDELRKALQSALVTVGPGERPSFLAALKALGSGGASEPEQIPGT